MQDRLDIIEDAAKTYKKDKEEKYSTIGTEERELLAKLDMYVRIVRSYQPCPRCGATSHDCNRDIYGPLMTCCDECHPNVLSK